MPHPHDVDPPKRKREIDDHGGQATLVERIPQPPPPQSGSGAINYLSRSHADKLKLIPGDCDIFGDIIGLIAEYEGVLSRQESLAANLGAKLTGPRLVKAMEGMFEGPITIVPDHRQQHPPSSVSWLDIVQYAKAQPQNFTMHSTPDRGRVCRVVVKNTQVEITDDDWRMIRSGALERFRLAAEPLEDDENAELASVDIVEDRLDFLIKKADEVARKARQLNYHLSGRRAAIKSKRSTSGFQSVNRSPSSTPNAAYDIHTDLLQQFLAAAPTARSSVSSLPTSPLPNPSSRQTAGQSNRAPRTGGSDTNRDADDGPMAKYKPLITGRIEKLASGETIFPPCDRCRRLKSPCVKHLTACQGCTRKHAKCSWKTITEDEIAQLGGEPTSAAPSRAAPESRGDSDGERSNHGGGGSVRSRDPLSEEIRQAQHSGYRQEYLPPISTEPRPSQPRLDRMDVDQDEHRDRREHEVVSRSRDVPLHSLLTRVASAATAAADARDGPNGRSPGRDSR